MKLSLNWIFDHIKGNRNSIMIADLVDRFIKTTAEIEGVVNVTLPVDHLTLVRINSIDGDVITGYSPELEKSFNLPARSDGSVGLWYLVEHDKDSVAWAKINSVGGVKDTVLPAIEINQSLQAGEWKNSVELTDCIIEIDNKSINHRPDMWGHRGVAREIAAILNIPFIPLDQFISDKKTVEGSQAFAGQTGDFSVVVQTPDLCKQFSAFSIEKIEQRPSSLDMVIRLSRLDSRSINYLIDCTNYVMLDLGQPMHAFDAHSLLCKSVSVRRAQVREKITILDGAVIELTTDDLVIADGSTPVSLAGIMGGLATGVTNSTTALFLEAAHFDATTIRRTAARCKKRTEASMRFAKSLDPFTVVDAIKRYLFLLDKQNVSYSGSHNILQLGNRFHPVIIPVAHAHIEQLLGLKITSEQIIDILEKLSFKVIPAVRNNECWYDVAPPSFRMTKDISIAQDIIEEVGRYIGYDSIPRVMPALQRELADLSPTYRVRTIKEILTDALTMRELYGYSFFDEQFLKTVNWDPTDCIFIKNPISEIYTRMVSSLQPHLLKAVGENSEHHKKLRFYEWARVWSLKNDVMSEKKSLSGVFFEQESTFDFYDGKALLYELFDKLKMTIEWRKTKESIFPWLSVNQTALLFHNGVEIGIAGMIEQAVMQNLSVVKAQGFIFEIDGNYIEEYKVPSIQFVPLPKYPSVRRDVSMLVPLSTTVDMLIDIIKKSDVHICTVTLVDFFTKDEWHNKKAITFHVEMRDNHKTLDSNEVDALWNNVITRLQEYGAQIR